MTTPTVPVIENIHQKVYAAASQPGALNMRRWHTCETTHCRAGWVIVLAGNAGRELERIVGTARAAQMIYEASSTIKVAHEGFFQRTYESFSEHTAAAMADMARLAELEAAQ